MKNLYIHMGFILLLVASTLSAQQDTYKWRIGLHGGLMNYYGDLSYKFWDTNPQLNDLLENLEYVSYGAALEKRLSQAWGLRLLYSNGEFIANDRTIDGDGNLRTGNPNFLRSLNARTEISDFSILLNYHFDNSWAFGKKAIIAPYLTAGLGWSDFSVYGDLFTESGSRYYYWKDNTIRDVAEGSGETGNIIEQDGNFETNLAELNTEGVDYDSDLFHLSAGIGLKFRLSERLNLNLETIFRFTDSDYLDDVSGAFPENYASELQAYASNPANVQGTQRGDADGNDDIYSLTTLSIHYNFGRRKQAFQAPIVRTGYLPYEESVDAPDTSMAVLESASVPADSMMEEVPVMQSKADVTDSKISPEGADSLYAGIQEISGKIDSLSADIRQIGAIAPESTQELSRRVDRLEIALEELKEQQQSGSAEQDELREQLVKMEAEVETIKNQTGQPGVSPGEYRPDTVVRVIERPVITPAPLSDESIGQMQEELAELRATVEAQAEAEAMEPQSQNRRKAIRELQEQLDQQAELLEQGQTDQASFDALQRSIALLRFDLATSGGPVAQSDPSAKAERDSLQQEVNRLKKQTQELNLLVGRLEKAVRGDTFDLVLPNTDVARLHQQVDSLTAQLERLQTEKERREEAMEMNIDRLEGELKEMQLQMKKLEGQPTPVEPEVDERSLLQQKIADRKKNLVFFAVNSSTLNLAARQTLDEVVELLLTHNRLQVRITGYTDTSGNPVYNKALAGKRAQAVAGYLQQNEIDQARISVEGVGEDASAEAAFGRRVEVVLRVE